MEIEKYLKYEIDRISKKLPYNDMITFCEKIIDEKDVGMDKYSKELLALELEKQIIMCVETNLSQKDKISFFDKLQLEEPLFIENKHYLKKYIRLFLKKRNDKNENVDLSKIEEFYNDELLKRSNKFTNKMITLPGGTKISGKEMIDALVKTMNTPIMAKSHTVKITNKRAPLALRLNMLIGVLAGEIALSFTIVGLNRGDVMAKQVVETEIDKQTDAVEYETDGIITQTKETPYKTTLVPHEYINELGKQVSENNIYHENIISSNDIYGDIEKTFNIYGIIPSIDDFKYTSYINEAGDTIFIGKNGKEIKSNIDTIKLFLENIYSENRVDLEGFEGYDIHSVKESDELLKTKQSFLYYLCKKEGIEFNYAMAIWDRESGGNFNLNGTSNETEDYGEMQITKANHSNIESIFGFTTEDLKNNWMKNMIAAVFMIKELQIKNGNEPGKIFGEYNGGPYWQEINDSRNYSKETLKLLWGKYNLSDEELFNNREVSNGQNLRS
ncbi:MAG: hypothetical protein E7158_04745 [Firmicutes bacterium]|nr:hypothetical protein [Bacillota bacterium]